MMLHCFIFLVTKRLSFLDLARVTVCELRKATLVTVNSCLKFMPQI